MPLTQLSLSGKMAFTFQATPTGSAIGFAGATQGQNSISFSLLNVALATWNNVYAANLVIFVTAPTSLTGQLVLGGTLTVSQPYYYKITGTGGTQESAGSNEVSATPTSGNQSVKLTWPAFQGATGYKVYRGTSAGAENVLLTTITNSTTLTYTDTGGAGSAGSVPSAPASFIEFDLSSFTNLAGEAVTPGHALGLIVAPSGINAGCQLAPGTTNGLTWFFGGTTPYLQIPITALTGNGGGVLVTGPSDYAGQVIDSTHKTLRITNSGTGNLSCSVGVIVGP